MAGSRSRSRSRSRPRSALNLKKIFPEGTSWANVVNNVPRAPAAAAEPHRGSYVPPHRREKGGQQPEEGETRGEGKNMMIYTRKSILLANGSSVRGRWVKATDPYGDYGGPYADMRNMLDNPRYKADMKDIFGKPGRSRSRDSRGSRRSRGYSRRHRSRSRSSGRSRSRSRQTRRHARG